MSEQMIRKVICDHLCGQEVLNVEEDPETQQLMMPDGWYDLTAIGEVRMHFCSLECLAQWVASQVGKSLVQWKLNPPLNAAVAGDKGVTYILPEKYRGG